MQVRAGSGGVELELTVAKTLANAFARGAPSDRRESWAFLSSNRKWSLCEPSWGNSEMEVAFPDFANQFLTDLSVCAFIDDDELCARFAEKKVRGDAKYGADHWARIFVGPRERKEGTRGVHFHLDFKRSFGPTKKPPTISIDDFHQLLDAFSGRSVKCWVRGRFVVENTNIPQDGLLSVIRGVSVIAGDGRLTLTGGTLQYSGETYDEVMWRILDEKSTEIVLDAFVTATVDNEYIINAAQTVCDGLVRFALESK
jgi:hypothetical protein